MAQFKTDDTLRQFGILMSKVSQVDVIYIAASARDSRFTRICVASVRYFYPEIPIRILVGGPLQQGLAKELRLYWNVHFADIPRGDYGWGFVKLEPLFGSSGERFLVLDSDTVLTGLVLNAWPLGKAPFLVNDELQSNADINRLYYDWEKLRVIDANASPPQFVFNSGQWFGTAGVLSRNDFVAMLEWSMPPKLRYPACFMPGDQGILNYVLNQKIIQNELRVERREIMCWPGHSMKGITAETIERRSALPFIIHWAGIKKARLRDMIGADVLVYFERYYYRRLRAGTVRRFVAACRYPISHYIQLLKLMVKIRFRRTVATFYSQS